MAGTSPAKRPPPGPLPRRRSVRQYRSRITCSRGNSEEDTVARRLYYQDSSGRVHRARSAERSRGLPGRLAVKFLMILAVLVVLASLVH